MNSDLIRNCQLGDVNSFSELYCLHKKKALLTAYLISNQKGIAEDIVQESFIECFQKIKKLKDPEAFESWFYKILVRTGWRMAKKQNRFIPMDDKNMEGLSNSEYYHSQLEVSETNIMICEAIARLSLPLKTVVILYYFNDMSIERISKVLGCFQGTVKSRLYIARKELYKVLNEDQLKETSLKACFKKHKEYGYDGNA